MPPKKFIFPPLGTRVLVKTLHAYEGKCEVQCYIENYDEHCVALQFRFGSLGDYGTTEGRRTLYKKAFKNCFIKILEDIDHKE